MDCILKEYKNLKQKILKKAKKKDNYYETKEKFFKTEIKFDKKPEYKKPIPIESLPISNTEPQNEYVDSPNVLNIFKENENSNLDKTKNILMDLSELMSHFTTKIYQHHEITQNSKSLLL